VHASTPLTWPGSMCRNSHIRPCSRQSSWLHFHAAARHTWGSWLAGCHAGSSRGGRRHASHHRAEFFQQGFSRVLHAFVGEFTGDIGIEHWSPLNHLVLMKRFNARRACARASCSSLPSVKAWAAWACRLAARRGWLLASIPLASCARLVLPHRLPTGNQLVGLVHHLQLGWAERCDILTGISKASEHAVLQNGYGIKKVSRTLSIGIS